MHPGYRHAALPIIVLGVLSILRIFVYIQMIDIGDWVEVGTNLLHAFSVIELWSEIKAENKAV